MVSDLLNTTAFFAFRREEIITLEALVSPRLVTVIVSTASLVGQFTVCESFVSVVSVDVTLGLTCSLSVKHDFLAG